MIVNVVKMVRYWVLVGKDFDAVAIRNREPTEWEMAKDKENGLTWVAIDSTIREHVFEAVTEGN